MKVTKFCNITIELNCNEARILSSTLLRAIDQHVIAQTGVGPNGGPGILKAIELSMARKVVAALGRTEEDSDCFRENEAADGQGN